MAMYERDPENSDELLNFNEFIELDVLSERGRERESGTPLKYDYVE